MRRMSRSLTCQPKIRHGKRLSISKLYPRIISPRKINLIAMMKTKGTAMNQRKTMLKTKSEKRVVELLYKTCKKITSKREKLSSGRIRATSSVFSAHMTRVGSQFSLFK